MTARRSWRVSHWYRTIGWVRRHIMSRRYPPQWAEELLCNQHHVLRRLERIMSNQDTLNAYVAELGDSATKIAAEIQGLKDQVANLPGEVPLDFSALDTAVKALDALEPPVVEEPPVEEPPVEAPVEEPAGE